MAENDYEIIVRDVSYKYPGAENYALKDVSVSAKKGEIILITGPNGAGKTTFCNLLNGLIPHFYGGTLEGDVIVHGIETKKSFVGALAKTVGLLFQDPASQLITGSVEDEVAFGLENIGLPVDEIEKRIESALKFVGLNEFRDRPPFALSGGQQQALALACILAMNPEIYVLDEPTSNLDPIGTNQVFDLLHKIATEERKTFVVVEHKLEELIDIADRVIVFNEGKKVAEGTPRDILGGKAEFLEQLGLSPPQVALLAYKLKHMGLLDEIPLTLEEGVEVFSKLLKKAGVKENFKNVKEPTKNPQKENIPEKGEPIIVVKDLHFTYPTGTVALKGVSLEIYENEFIAIIGQNGSGKTTLVKHFNGLLKPTEGDVIVFGKNTREAPTHELITYVGYVFQNPDQQLFSRRVYDELAFGLKNIGLSKDEIDERIKVVAKRMNIEHLLDEIPFSLSKGDRQRIAISSILALDPKVIVVDEPTTGQDPRKRREIMDLMSELHKEGKTIIVITHDMDLVAEYAKRCVVMSDGKILLEGTPKEVFVQTEVLASTHLNPPTITRLFIELNKQYNVPKGILTVNEAAEYFKSLFNIS